MKRQSPIFKITIGAMFIALTAIGANITSIVPFLVIGGVPITLQTFFAILTGLVLGSRLGAFTMFGYMLLGLAGVPVFAQFSGGFSMILSPTFGFILSFILVAYVAGKIREKYNHLTAYIIASLVALVINYVIGTNWMYIAYQFWFEAPPELSYGLVWLWMLAPLPKDIILSILAGILAYRLASYNLTVYDQTKVAS